MIFPPCFVGETENTKSDVEHRDDRVRRKKEKQQREGDKKKIRGVRVWEKLHLQTF